MIYALMVGAAVHVQNPAAAQSRTFVIHGTPKACSDIVQLDSALAAGAVAYFNGWTERDFADAFAWAEFCKDYGWHIPGQPRIPLLKAQRDRMLPARPAPPPAPLPPASPANAPQATVAPAAKTDPLLTDEYYKAHFHQESLWVARKANLNIGEAHEPTSWPSEGTVAQLKNRLTADKIVLFCAHRSTTGAETEVRPLLWDWRRCEEAEAAAYKRLVFDNEFPTAGRAAVFSCAGLDSYLRMERCIETLAPARKP